MNVLVDVAARSGSRCPYTCVLISLCCTTLIDILGKGRNIIEIPLERWGFGSSGGCCIWFHVICCAWLRVMFQIMECVASSISRWLGCKAEYYLLSCSTHSVLRIQRLGWMEDIRRTFFVSGDNINVRLSTRLDHWIKRSAGVQVMDRWPLRTWHDLRSCHT